MSTITRELAKLFRKITNSEIDAEGNAHVVLSPADSLLINNARIALASLEAEPVAWLLSGGGAKNHVSFDSGNAYADPLREVTPLYTAPPAPVALPSGYSDFEEIWSSSTHPLTQDDEMKDFAWDIWNACRAAMLQSAGVTEKCRSSENVQEVQEYPETLPCPVFLEPALRFGKGVPTRTMLGALQRRAEYYAELEDMTPEQRAEHDANMNELAAMLQGAEPDFRETSNSSTNNFRENAETSTKCWCRTCRPLTFSDSRFVVCPECGNKRCPHANDHRNACTGSNEPGQEGSAYPAAPQQEVK